MNLPKVGLAEGARGPDVADLRAYLARYGYLRADPRKVAADLDAEFDRATTEALTRYQRFYGLKVTGKLTRETVDLMSKPRCGFPDVAASTITEPGRYGYVLNAWGPYDHRDLSYKIEDHTADLTLSVVQAAIAEACSKWAGVSGPGLTFALVDPPTIADEDIMFFSNASDPGGALANCFEDKSIVFYDNHTWQVTPVSAGAYDFMVAAMHEIGHALGLDHSPETAAVMYATQGTGDRSHELHSDDIAGIQALYPAPPPPPTPPDPPTNVTATALSVSEIRVAWSPAARAASYQVRVADSQSGPWQALGPPTVATSYVHAGLAPNTSRFYSVQSISSAGAVADSTNIALGLTWPATPPAAPTGVAAVVRGASGAVPLAVELTWAPTYRAERYQVVVAGVPSHEFRARGPTAFHWYTDPLVRAGHASWPAAPQQFTVRAVNGYGASVDSSAVSATVPRAPA